MEVKQLTYKGKKKEMLMREENDSRGEVTNHRCEGGVF